MLKFLLEKEYKQIRRNSFLPRMIVMMPLMMMIVFPWVGTMEVKEINLCVVDYDRSELSRQIVSQIASSDYFVLKKVVASYDEAMKMIEYGTADSYVEIPIGFESQLIRREQPQMLVASNSVNGVKGGLSNQYLTSIITSALQQTSVANGASLSANDVTIRNAFNPYLDYKVFMIPALISMLVSILTGFLPALSIVSEKEKGTIVQINVTPVNRYIFILSKLIPCWIIGFVVLTICFIVSWALYGLIPLGGIGVIYLTMVVYILITSGLGLVVSNYSETLQQAMFVMFFFIIIFVLMSGLFTPITSMPLWAQKLTFINPLKYFIQIIRGVYLKGSSLSDIATPLLTLAVFACGTALWAVVSYRKKN